MKNKLILFGLIGFFIIGLTLIINKSERPNKQTLNWFNGNLEEAQASLDENQIIKLLQKLVKQRNESAKIYKEQNRDELAEIEESQSKVISEYLPEQLNQEELINIINEVIISTGAESIKDMGKVIGVTNAKVLGRAEGRVIADLVKSKLNSL